MISVCIPCYNEEKIIRDTYFSVKNELKKLKVDYEIIFCNDGSTDNTLEKLKIIKSKDKYVKILSYTPNKGVGEAYRRMFENVQSDYLIIIDADLAIHPINIKKFYHLIKKTGFDVVIGSRYSGISAEYPFIRKLISRFYYLFYRVLFGIKIRDVESGFAIFKGTILKNVYLESKGFESLLEIYLKLLENNYNIKELPVKFVHRKDSKVKLIKHSLITIGGTIAIFIKWKKRLFQKKKS